VGRGGGFVTVVGSGGVDGGGSIVVDGGGVSGNAGMLVLGESWVLVESLLGLGCSGLSGRIGWTHWGVELVIVSILMVMLAWGDRWKS
jgi:hypothetical protein